MLHGSCYIIFMISDIMNILLLDTCDDIQTALKLFLESQGHKVQACDTPTSAISICKLFDVQLLISEHFPSDENYPKLFKSLHDKELVTKIMVLSGNTLSLSESQNLTTIGVDCIFVKPIDPEIILNTIEIFEKSLKLIAK